MCRRAVARKAIGYDISHVVRAGWSLFTHASMCFERGNGLSIPRPFGANKPPGLILKFREEMKAICNKRAVGSGYPGIASVGTQRHD